MIRILLNQIQLKIEVEPEPEKPVTPEEKFSNEVLVRVVFDGKPKANFKIALMEFDPIPNIIQTSINK